MSTKAIVIGLGGIGSEIVCELEKYLDEEKRKHDNVRFAIMDTDVNTIARVKREKFGGRIVTMSDRMTVGEYLADNAKAGEWFLKNGILDWKPVTEGAGQVRAVSRLAFEMAIQNGRLQPLYEAIRELHTMTGDAGSGASLRIIIVSTLAGGTGSGVLLPLALHLRKYLFDTYKRRDVIIRGMFLMSDCLERVVADESERKSLRGNTYAAVKELDAFMKKADGYLPQKYSSIYMENTSLNKTDNYMSYNFCYLFGARNGDNSELYSFQEIKRYIMQCIDAQILGPMQELNNSIEDNVLKSTLVKAKKSSETEFNRYCAAGIKVLQYPYHRILNYLGLKKALTVFSDQWMEVDTGYLQEKNKQRERERNGYASKEISRAEFYVNYVMSGSDRSPIIRQIRGEMYVDGGLETVGIWEKYLSALETDIREYAKQLSSKWRDAFLRCKMTLAAIEKNRADRTRNKFEQLQEAYDTLYDMIHEEVGAAMVGFGQRYFGIVQWEEELPPSHFMYWLKSNDGLKHLNSVRFFLYQTVQAMQEGYSRIQKEAEEEEYILQGIEEVKAVIPHIGNHWLSNTFSSDYRSALRGYKKRIDVLESYSVKLMLKRAYTVGFETLSRLSNMLETFYDNYDYNRRLYDSNQSVVLENLTKASGRVVQYVKADEKQLQGLVDVVCSDYERDREANHRLSADIFNRLWEVMDCSREVKNEQIKTIFQKNCIDFWKKNLEERYATELDINVAEAILQEGIQTQGSLRKYDYLRNKLEILWGQTIPFLQVDHVKSMGQIKDFCTYNPCLVDEDEQTGIILKEKLMQRGGIAGEEVDKYTIIFYRVTYNLRAEDVKEFSLGTMSFMNRQLAGFSMAAADTGMGATMRDYYDIVSMQMTTRLTPHLDWRWSNVMVMPDLNPAYTKYLEKRVYQAFYLLWVTQNIQREDRKNYSCAIVQDRENYSSLETILSRLAGSIDDVNRILEQLEIKTNQDIENGTIFEETGFMRNLNKQETPVFGLMVAWLQGIPRVRWDSGMIRNMAEGIFELLASVIEAYLPEKQSSVELRRLFKRSLQGNGVNQATLVYCKNIMSDVLRQLGRPDLAEEMLDR